MSNTICPCGRPTPGDTAVCGACVADLERALGDVGAWVDELETVLSRQSRIGSGSGGRRGAETSLPYDPHAGQLLARFRNTLSTWVRELAEHYEEPNLPKDHPADMSRWLLARIKLIRRHPAADEIVEEIVRLVETAEVTVDIPRPAVYAGPCNDCGVDLYGRYGAALVTCRSCGLSYDVAERQEWLLISARDVLGGAAEVARALSRLGTALSADRVYQWRKRGLLVAHGVTAGGAPAFRIGDVLDLLARMDSRGKVAS